MERHGIEGIQPCKKCDEWKALDGFRVDRSSRLRRGKTCKACFNASVDRDKSREQGREWYARKRQDPEWVERERARGRLKNARRRDADPAAARIRNRENAVKWRCDNPDKSYEYGRRSKLKHRILKAGGVWVEHVEPLVVLEMDDGICGICGLDVDPNSFSVDHIIPSSKGGEHSYANVQLAHLACNSAKSNKVLV